MKDPVGRGQLVSLSLNPFEFIRIYLSGCPLRHINVLVIIYTNIMRVFEQRNFLLHHLQLTVLIYRFGSTNVGNHFVVLINDDHKTGICKFHVRRTQYSRIQIIALRSEEHTSELQSLMRISYAVFCLKKKKY